MQITRHEIITEDELLSRIQRTRLKGHGQPMIYEGARLVLARRTHPLTLYPAQRYVLRDDLERILELHAAFRQQGVDIFALDGGLMFWLRDPENPDTEVGPIPLTPPVVEMSLEPDGRRLPLINDGMHRVYAALQLRSVINVVMVHDVPTEFPYYAFALPNGWSDVQELTALPEDFVKKSYRDPDNYKALFRDFNEVFPGVQKQRPRSNPAHLKP
ncbi:MAG: hypothetical protein HQL64_13135 [Magnetococcales bacterium]|nr:hypothetical protein [Magnetococcales bacterium]